MFIVEMESRSIDISAEVVGGTEAAPSSGKWNQPKPAKVFLPKGFSAFLCNIGSGSFIVTSSKQIQRSGESCSVLRSACQNRWSLKISLKITQPQRIWQLLQQLSQRNTEFKPAVLSHIACDM